MHAPYLREKARSMRVERNLTIDQIAERLALSRSSIVRACDKLFRAHLQARIDCLRRQWLDSTSAGA